MSLSPMQIEAMIGDGSPCMATCSGGKPSLVQEQVREKADVMKQFIAAVFSRNGRSLEPRSDARPREMVINPVDAQAFLRGNKTWLTALPTHTKTSRKSRVFLFISQSPPDPSPVPSSWLPTHVPDSVPYSISVSVPPDHLNIHGSSLKWVPCARPPLQLRPF